MQIGSFYISDTVILSMLIANSVFIIILIKEVICKKRSTVSELYHSMLVDRLLVIILFQTTQNISLKLIENTEFHIENVMGAVHNGITELYTYAETERDAKLYKEILNIFHDNADLVKEIITYAVGEKLCNNSEKIKNAKIDN